MRFIELPDTLVICPIDFDRDAFANLYRVHAVRVDACGEPEAVASLDGKPVVDTTLRRDLAREALRITGLGRLVDRQPRGPRRRSPGFSIPRVWGWALRSVG